MSRKGEEYDGEKSMPGNAMGLLTLPEDGLKGIDLFGMSSILHDLKNQCNKWERANSSGFNKETSCAWGKDMYNLLGKINQWSGYRGTYYKELLCKYELTHKCGDLEQFVKDYGIFNTNRVTEKGFLKFLTDYKTIITEYKEIVQHSINNAALSNPIKSAIQRILGHL